MAFAITDRTLAGNSKEFPLKLLDGITADMAESLDGRLGNPARHRLVGMEFQPAKDKPFITGVKARSFGLVLDAEKFQAQTSVWILWIDQPPPVDEPGNSVVARFGN